MRLFRALQQHKPEPQETPGAAGADSGPVIVLAGERRSDPDALEWATAEAAARESELRIVHPFRWPHVLGPSGLVTVDLRARAAAEEAIAAAVARADSIAPALTITPLVCQGRTAAALMSDAHRRRRALVVLGRDSRGQPLLRRLTRRPALSVALVGLYRQHRIGPSAGRVVVGVDELHPGPALGFAFRAARRRGTGLTIVHRASAIGCEDLVETIALWSLAHREVDVHRRPVGGSLDGGVLTESPGAALTVLSRPDVMHLVRGPVVRVGTA